jgi:NADH-quinone oxidoreductase subunit J
MNSMNIVFYISSGVAILTSLLAITRFNAMHGLLYLIVSLLSVGMVFLSLGAPFIGALEVIIYAGAIMVLFLFAVMLLNLGPQSIAQETHWLKPKIWVGPAIIAVFLLIELAFVLISGDTAQLTGAAYITPSQVGTALYGSYLLGVELASMLLLSGMVGSYHLGRRRKERNRRLDVMRGEEIVDYSRPVSSLPTRQEVPGTEGARSGDKS